MILKNNRKESMRENEFEIKFTEKTGLNFNKYYKEHMPKLTWFLASRMTKNVEKAEEFAHMAFIQGLEKIDTYDSDKAQLITWLTQIAKNLVIKSYKDSLRIDSVPFDAEINETPGFINIIGYDTGEEENEIHQDNVKKCEIIKQTIQTLPEKYRKVMTMREVQKMQYKDIADAIRKTTKKSLGKDEKIKLQTPEDFYSLTIDNIGYGDIEVDFLSGKDPHTWYYDKRGVMFCNDCGIMINDIDGKYSYTNPTTMKTTLHSPDCIKKDQFTRVVKAGENVTIVREEIEWERLPIDKFNVISDSSCNLVYVTTTNLSTIKSQIKKGRSLVQKKVKRPFELID